MAYTYDPNLTEEQRQQQAQGQAGQGGGPSGAAGPVMQTGAAPQPSSSTGGTQSGQFTNLQSYLKGNQGQQFGSQVAGKVQGDVDTANQGQQEAAGAFRGQVGAGTVNYNEGLANEAKSNALGVASDEAKRNEFTKMRDASYGGPNALTDVGDAYTKAQGANQNAQKAAQASGSEEGQRALLGQYYGRPTYSRGETSLDQFLVQSDKSAKPKFEQARQGAGQLESNFQGLQNTLAGEAQGAKAATEATKQRLNQEFLGEGGAYGQFQNTLQGQADAAKQQAQLGKQKLDQDFSQGRTGDQNLVGQDIYNLDMGKYSTVTDPTLAQTATQQQAGNYGALSQLLGQQNNIFTDPSQVGSYDPTKAVNFNREQFNADQAAAAQQYQNAINEQTFGGFKMHKGGGIIGDNALQSNMGLNDAITNTQQTLEALGNPTSTAGKNQKAAAYAQLQNLLAQQQGINTQYGAGKKLKSTNLGSGIGVR